MLSLSLARSYFSFPNIFVLCEFRFGSRPIILSWLPSRFNTKRILILLAQCIYLCAFSLPCILYMWLFVVNIFHINCQMQYMNKHTVIFHSLSLLLTQTQSTHNSIFTAHSHTELRAKLTSQRIYFWFKHFYSIFFSLFVCSFSHTWCNSISKQRNE